jgi:hypothetical protein
MSKVCCGPRMGGTCNLLKLDCEGAEFETAYAHSRAAGFASREYCLEAMPFLYNANEPIEQLEDIATASAANKACPWQRVKAKRQT